MKKTQQKANDYNQLEAISTATLIEEVSHTKLIMRGIIVIAAIIVILVVWSAFTTIDQVAVSQGELVPTNYVQIVQHLEGGIVKNVLVKNGSMVKKGQLLLTMDPTIAQSELMSLRSREIALIVNKQRLTAFIQNTPANIEQWGQAVINSQYNDIKRQQQIHDLLTAESKQLHAQYTEKNSEEKSLIAIINRRQEQLTDAKKQLENWHHYISLLQQDLKMHEKLRSSGIISKREELIKLREMNKAKGEKLKLESAIEQANQALVEAKNKLSSFDANSKQQALSELGDTNDQLLQIQNHIDKLSAQLQRVNIVAPENGIIQGVVAHAGSVIKPGGRILDLVPTGQALVAETQVKQRDIGHIKVGDPVKIKLLTYDFSRYGTIDGKIESISASSFSDNPQQPSYYKAIIQLDRQTLGAGKNAKHLMPGMAVEANVITGKRTLLAYLLKPISRASNQSFNER